MYWRLRSFFGVLNLLDYQMHRSNLTHVHFFRRSFFARSCQKATLAITLLHFTCQLRRSVVIKGFFLNLVFFSQGKLFAQKQQPFTVSWTCPVDPFMTGLDAVIAEIYLRQSVTFVWLRHPTWPLHWRKRGRLHPQSRTLFSVHSMLAFAQCLTFPGNSWMQSERWDFDMKWMTKAPNLRIDIDRYKTHTPIET